ncbi:hypothetical protein RSAG8_03257, partial [Rhizoctonia solani AG-8 WAC10335]
MPRFSRIQTESNPFSRTCDTGSGLSLRNILFYPRT